MNRPGSFLNRPPNAETRARPPRSLRLWVLFAVLVLLMQFSDPLADASMADVLTFWSIRLAAAAGSIAATDWLLRRFCEHRWNRPVWLKPAALFAVLTTLPMTVAEVTLESLIPQAGAYDDSALRQMSLLLAFVGEYLTILSVVLPVNLLLWVLIDRRLPGDRQAEAPTHEPSFLTKTRGVRAADVIALSAEEHYVRVWTADRSELVYGRLRDAIAEMPDARGLQVHRSWWVADAAVRAARRGARRYELELLNGTSVPVSDKFTQAARKRGLLGRG